MINGLYQCINAFERRLKQFIENNFVQFSRLNANHSTDKLHKFYTGPETTIKIKFTDIHSRKSHFEFSCQPYDLELESANEDFQMGLFELKSN